MKKQLTVALALSIGLLTASSAMANDALWGALIGGGVGAVVGQSVGGRDGAIIGSAIGAATGASMSSEERPAHNNRRVEYVNAPVYYSAPAYYPQQVFVPPPMRVEQRSVYYVQGGDRWDNPHYRHNDRRVERRHEQHGYWR